MAHQVNCKNHGEWMKCATCEGRLHLPQCTAQRDPKKDCCRKRHETLHAQGQTFGIDDRSVPMLPYRGR